MPLLDTIAQMKTSIFTDDFLDDHQDQLDLGPANNAASRMAVPTDSDVIFDDTSAHPPAASEPVPPTIPKKRGQPLKKAQVGTSKESGLFDLLSACIDITVYAPPEPLPKAIKNITYYLAIFLEAEMKKGKKQRKASNKFLQTKSDHKWDTIKAQLLEKIDQTLRPKVINFDDYSFSWSVLHYQPLQMQLQTDVNYQFLVTHALKPKKPVVNIRVKTKPAKVHIFDSIPCIYHTMTQICRGER